MNSAQQVLLLSDPAEFLVFSSDSSDKSCSVVIKNVSNDNIAFKVKSNAPKFYKVVPNKGLLSKGQSISLLIHSRSSGEVLNHSFMILCQVVNKFIGDFAQTWNNSPQILQKIKLKVVKESVKARRNSKGESLKPLILQRDTLKQDLKVLIEELKTCRINTLKSKCDKSKEYAWAQLITCLILGFFIGFLLPPYLKQPS